MKEAVMFLTVQHDRDDVSSDIQFKNNWIYSDMIKVYALLNTRNAKTVTFLGI